MRSNLPSYEIHIARKLIKKFLWCVILFSFGCYLYTSTMEAMGATQNNKIYILIILIVSGIVCALCVGFPQLMLDKKWQGTVVSKNVRHGYVVAHTNGRGRMARALWLDLTVKRDDGKIKKITYNLRETSEKYYNVGDRVLHLKGSKFLLRPDRREDEIICPLCASTLKREECYHCRIKFSTKSKFY